MPMIIQINRFFLLLLLVFSSFHLVFGQVSDTEWIRCGSVDRDHYQSLSDKAYFLQKLDQENTIAEYLQNRNNRIQGITAFEKVTIPVVVHIVYNSKNIGNREGSGAASDNNILDAQVRSQIAVLNEDFSNNSGIKSFYSDSLGVDTQIRFQLVEITHQYSAIKEFNSTKEANRLAEIAIPWPTERYLNIWVCQLIPQYLGSSQFPVVEKITDETKGLNLVDSKDNPATDGIIIDYRYFGKSAAPIVSKLYNLGRTTTHEIGHWLGLIHIWGDARCGNDFCEDTPVAEKSNETTNSNCIPVYSNCSRVLTRNMIDNYMDYSPDRCMSLFTKNQAERMHAVLALSPRRAKLIAFSKRMDQNLSMDIYPNPVLRNDLVNLEIYTPNYQPFTIDVFNALGILVLSNVNNISKINIKNFASGIYFIRLNSGTQHITKRFVIH